MAVFWICVTQAWVLAMLLVSHTGESEAMLSYPGRATPLPGAQLRPHQGRHVVRHKGRIGVVDHLRKFPLLAVGWPEDDGQVFKGQHSVQLEKRSSTDENGSDIIEMGKITNPIKTMETCQHHLDCLPGNCCDLRQQKCRPHNRGLNNKCYDDCMCEEGLRCYGRPHPHRGVSHRRGRCVETDSGNRKSGAFIKI
ncbi:draxin-A [Osmerus eperlanus]|uniref:draxin-A n=1 Tax=Osmerus eperlanus TaxID=29151 RepID=UPI002E165CE1